MPVEDVFTITGRGTVATGRVERGIVKSWRQVEIVGLTDRERKPLYRRRNVPQAAGLSGSWRQHRRSAAWYQRKKSSVARFCPNRAAFINPHTKFKGEVYVLNKEEGGRHTPFFNSYRPQFYFPYHRRYRRYQAAGRR